MGVTYMQACPICEDIQYIYSQMAICKHNRDIETLIVIYLVLKLHPGA